MTVNLNDEQALDIIAKSLNYANTKGTFNLADSANILNALQILNILVNNTKTLKRYGDSYISDALETELQANKPETLIEKVVLEESKNN